MSASRPVCLQLRDAELAVDGHVVVEPVTLALGAGERRGLFCAGPEQAEYLAMMAAALALPTTGSVLIGEYDPRVQPVHCKRLAGFVPHDPLPLAAIGADRFIAYRAALWNIDIHQARTRATLLLERLGNMHESFAYPIAAALLHFPPLLVLDRPQPAYVDAIVAAAGPCAIFSTHLDDESARLFTATYEVRA